MALSLLGCDNITSHRLQSLPHPTSTNKNMEERAYFAKAPQGMAANSANPPPGLQQRLRRSFRRSLTLNSMTAVSKWHEFREKTSGPALREFWRTLTMPTTPYAALYIDASASDVAHALRESIHPAETREEARVALEAMWSDGSAGTGHAIATMSVRSGFDLYVE